MIHYFRYSIGCMFSSAKSSILAQCKTHGKLVDGGEGNLVEHSYEVDGWDIASDMVNLI
jgi:hypothetical protein